MQAGSVVTVSHPERGQVVGTIERLDAPVSLPDLPGAPPADLVRAIFDEVDVDRIALISYSAFFNETPEPRDLCFFALHTRAGNWFDLRGELLTILEVPSGNAS